MRKVLLNAVGGLRAGDIFDPDQGQQGLIDAAESVGGKLVDATPEALSAAEKARAAYARGAGASATAIMLAELGGAGASPAAPVTIALPTDGAASSTSIEIATAAILTLVLARVSAAMTGSGSVEVKIGTTDGGDEVLLAQTIDNAVPAGTVFGQDTTQVGADFISDTGFTKTYPAGTVLFVTLTPTGQVLTGSLRVYLEGANLT